MNIKIKNSSYSGTVGKSDDYFYRELRKAQTTGMASITGLFKEAVGAAAETILNLHFKKDRPHLRNARERKFPVTGKKQISRSKFF